MFKTLEYVNEIVFNKIYNSRNFGKYKTNSKGVFNGLKNNEEHELHFEYSPFYVIF